MIYMLCVFGLMSCSDALSFAADTRLDSQSLDWFPPHLRGATSYEASAAVIAFAKSNGARNVVFVEDQEKCGRSVQQNRDIFVNVRATYWDANMLPPWLCRSPAEAILQRFLHELGHITHHHHGTPGIESTQSGLILPPTKDPWDALRNEEEDCWHFVFRIRSSSNETYQALLADVRRWYESHSYSNKDWDDTPEAQWKRKNESDFPKGPWLIVPAWVREKFHKYEKQRD